MELVRYQYLQEKMKRHNEAMATPSSAKCLMTLPPEIRRIIWAYIIAQLLSLDCIDWKIPLSFTDDTDEHFSFDGTNWICSVYQLEGLKEWRRSGLLLSPCRVIRQEFTEVFYESVTMQIDCTPLTYAARRPGLPLPLLPKLVSFFRPIDRTLHARPSYVRNLRLVLYKHNVERESDPNTIAPYPSRTPIRTTPGNGSRLLHIAKHIASSFPALTSITLKIHNHPYTAMIDLVDFGATYPKDTPAEKKLSKRLEGSIVKSVKALLEIESVTEIALDFSLRSHFGILESVLGEFKGDERAKGVVKDWCEGREVRGMERGWEALARRGRTEEQYKCINGLVEL